ncbi:hypothetical protein [Mitsuaria sp. 7]|uniref:hypothetical protein n=1 Tax=Mitsuaria sp. 7 TaxID=1658665 RepID=UPI0012FB833A|nr:hypothetical protein [Mitsuaria sp. 7]
MNYSAAPFDLAAYERLCRDVDHDPNLIRHLRRIHQRGTFWKEYLTGEDAYLVYVAPFHVSDLYRYYLFSFRGVCCEISRRHEMSEVIEVSLIGDRDALLPDSYETALLTAMEAFTREVQVSTRERVVPRIEWRRETLTARSMERAMAPDQGTALAKLQRRQAQPASAMRHVPPARRIFSFLGLYVPLFILGLLFCLLWAWDL